MLKNDVMLSILSARLTMAPTSDRGSCHQSSSAGTALRVHPLSPDPPVMLRVILAHNSLEFRNSLTTPVIRSASRDARPFLYFPCRRQKFSARCSAMAAIRPSFQGGCRAGVERDIGKTVNAVSERRCRVITVIELRVVNLP